jgi:hypothetical protein
LHNSEEKDNPILFLLLKEDVMPCLFAVFAGLFPRIGTLLIWLARPTYFNSAFGGSWLWPILGIIFLPFTTLMYVLLWTPGLGLVGFDWVWLILGVVVDLTHYGAAGYAQRDRLPGYTPAST